MGAVCSRVGGVGCCACFYIRSWAHIPKPRTGVLAKIPKTRGFACGTHVSSASVQKSDFSHILTDFWSDKFRQIRPFRTKIVNTRFRVRDTCLVFVCSVDFQSTDPRYVIVRRHKTQITTRFIKITKRRPCRDAKDTSSQTVFSMAHTCPPPTTTRAPPERQEGYSARPRVPTANKTTRWRETCAQPTQQTRPHRRNTSVRLPFWPRVHTVRLFTHQQQQHRLRGGVNVPPHPLDANAQPHGPRNTSAASVGCC